MALPTVYQSVLTQDFSITPMTVNKRYIVQRTDLYSGSSPITGSGYKLWKAVYFPEKLKLGTARTYPTNSVDGTYQHVIWSSIDSRYYRYPNDSIGSLEHTNQRFTYKFLNISGSVIQIPQSDFGEGILPGSVEITSSLGFNLTDDKNGNLYDPSISTGSYTTPSNLIAWWNVNDRFRVKNYDQFTSGPLPYVSHIFSPDRHSIYNNVAFVTGKTYYPITSSQILGSGLWMDLNINTPNLDGYVLTDNRPEFNFPDGQDFSIAFWMSGFDISEGPIISKRGVVLKDTFGSGQVLKGSGYISSSFVGGQQYFDEAINVYPYDFNVGVAGKMFFTRSDGINTISISSSVAVVGTDSPRHICVTKSGSLCSMYLNGVLSATGSDRTNNPINRHCIMFGAVDRTGTTISRCLLNDVRFYNNALDSSQVQTLAMSASLSMVQTAIAGNVFYKNGLVVVSSHDPKYNNFIDYDFTVRYRNTHTIYQYELVTRIPKGSFNLTMNPTALQNPYTDLLINDMTSSNNPNSDLYPYVTEIGYYDNDKNLLAVAKLSQPLKMRPDVDINIVTRFDI